MTTLSRCFFLVTAMALLPWNGAKAGITNYVSDLTGNDSGDGLTWETAKKSIQGAVDSASPGDTVLVTNGVYYLSSEIVLSKAVTLLGIGGPIETIIDGSNTCRCINISSSGVAVEGFSIRNGFLSDNKGAGVLSLFGGVLSNCYVYGNITSNAVSSVHNEGGGLFFLTGTIDSCKVFSNTTSSSYGGGGIFLQDSGTVVRCEVYGNRSTGSGGGVRCGGVATVEASSIHHNSAGYGAGVSVGGSSTFSGCRIYNNDPGGSWLSSTGTMRNCLIYDNVGQGIVLRSQNAKVENCTITGNDEGVSVNSGVYATNVFRNVILYGNFTGANRIEYVCPADAVFAADFSCLSPLPSIGVGNIIGDPLFVDASNSNFRLDIGSPCIDAGTNLDWMATATAIGGQPRLFNGRVDIGADESAFLRVWADSPTNGPGSQWSNAFHAIQGAVDASALLGTVLVTNGTYTLTSQILITNGITLRSTSGTNFTTVDGNYAAGCFSISHPLAIVEGFTITRGSNTQDWIGGGAYMSAGTLKDCIITENWAGQGGGVYFDQGGAVSNCTISRNFTDDSGGGIFCQYGGVVRNTTIISNTASGRGGGIRLFGGGLLESSTVIGNTGGAFWGGAALRFDNGGVATNCTITQHVSSDDGGVIRFSGSGALFNCTISSNSGPDWAVFFDTGNGSTAVNCRIIGNVGGSGPGGCAFMKDCYIAGNTATNGWGGGMTISDGWTAIGCTIVNNLGGGVRVWAGALSSSTIVSNWGGGVEMCGGGSLLNCTSRWNRAAWGAGVNCWGGNNRMVGCVIANNAATNSPGGGVACGLGDMLVDSIIVSNTAPTGGGIWFNLGGIASNCLILGNIADFGGGVGCYSNGTVQNCWINDNSAAQVGGGLLWNQGGSAVNCLITSNRSASNGSGVDCFRGGEVLNCTICANTSTGSGVGVFLNEGGTVRNTILQNDTDWSYNNGGWTMEYCRYSTMGPSSPGFGNITDNPQFVDDSRGDFRLATNSPCIDKGSNDIWMVSAIDLDGKPRIIHGAVDMGAFEAILPSWDTDGDTIPDLWTWEHFGHLTGLAGDLSRATDSADGTGRDNLYKYAADLDPTNPLSFFQIAAVSNMPPSRFVRFLSSSNRVYDLKWSTNLISGSWMDVSDQTNVWGTGTLMSLGDTNPASLRFYKVDVKAP